MPNTVGLGGSEVPLERNLLYKPAAEALVARRHDAVNAIANYVRADRRAEFLSRSEEMVPETLSFSSEHFSFEFGEVNGILLHFMVNQDDSFLRIDCELFSGNYPFAYEEDLERFPDDFRYSILTSAEFPPFIANAVEFDNLTEQGEDTDLNRTGSYLQGLQQQGKLPRFLQEKAQKDLILAISQVGFNIEETADEIFNKAPASNYLQTAQL